MATLTNRLCWNSNEFKNQIVHAVLFEKLTRDFPNPEIKYEAWALRSASGNLDTGSFKRPSFSEEEFLLLVQELDFSSIPYFIL